MTETAEGREPIPVSICEGNSAQAAQSTQPAETRHILLRARASKAVQITLPRAVGGGETVERSYARIEGCKSHAVPYFFLNK